MSSRARWGARQYLLVFLDVLIGPLSYLLAFYIRFRGLPPANFHAFEAVAVFVAVLGVGVNSLYGLYEEIGSREEALALSVTSAFLVLVLTMSLSFFLRAFALPRSAILLAWPLQAVLYAVVRMAFGKGVDESTVVRRRADQLVPQDVLNETAAGRDIVLEPDLVTLLLSTARIVRLPDGVALALSAQEMHPHQRILRRTIDLVLGLLGLLALGILIIPIGLLVILDSGRPIFYAQERVGLGERVFRIHKIRTMRKDAEQGTGAVLAQAGDERVTGVGKFLRATRLDELPQVWNVLRGEMSIVGPRPERPELYEEYKQSIPGYAARTLVRPGMTGLAQVYGTYATQPGVKLQYDLVYIFRYSLGLDLFIILRTISVLLQPSKARGAAQEVQTWTHSAH
ncbi:MAG: sugar transferase [Thermaerobacter sp.]|nr:sugar transferase [Thermaerobacter sp.]